jgi:hypothetical protein
LGCLHFFSITPPASNNKLLLLLSVAGVQSQILRNVDAPFETVNILENDALRTGMKQYSQWPT